MHAYIVTDPDAMMVELICAPVAPLAVFRILQYMRVAYITVKVIVT